MFASVRPWYVPLWVSVLTLIVACSLGRPAAAVGLHDFSSVQAETRDLLIRHGLGGVSLRVSRQGNVLYREAFGAHNGETRVPIASASKWLSALAIARLIDRGRMRWSDTIGQSFPNAPPGKRAITLDQLFSHTSGITNAEGDCLDNSAYTLASCAERLLQLPMIGPPGLVFAYGNNSMQIAGRMAELATGKTWDEIVLEEVVQPLGLQATDYAYDSSAPGYVRNANPRIASGVRSTLEDYGRIVDMILADGCLDGGFPQFCAAGRRYLSSATLAAMARDRTVGSVILYAPQSVAGYGYGFGFWIEPPVAPGALPVILSPGAFGFTPWVDRSANVAGVLLVEDSINRLMADISRLRARVRLATAEGTGARIKLPAPHGQETHATPRTAPAAAPARLPAGASLRRQRR